MALVDFGPRPAKRFRPDGCVMTTIDPETGVMEPKREPLKTLKTYRQVSDPREKKLEGDAPVMGIYMGLHTPGKIRTGDPVYWSEFLATDPEDPGSAFNTS
uniref:MOSC domain-containing protein n=1 Tax=Timema poppense TaxID=170557 RepID=A0A7R9CH28_TIMPO|nr:unnamed protein product [Timema poppensis]